MQNYKRPQDIFVRFTERDQVDLDLLVQGELEHVTTPVAFASTPIVDGEMEVTGDELTVLARLSSRTWRPAAEIESSSEVLDGLVVRGLVLSDRDAGACVASRECEQQYREEFWNPFAAFYHFNARSRGEISTEDAQADRVRSFEESPPNLFFDHPATSDEIELPKEAGRRKLGQLLRARRTTRSFDRDRPLPISELSAVLHQACGSLSLIEGDLYDVQLKAVPSAGALHPIEIYPLVRDVDGLVPGMYHYNVRCHRLDLIESHNASDIERQVHLFTTGQRHLAGAHVTFILAARFYRHNWRYRGQNFSYRAMLLEAGHISQTLILSCVDRGLGAYFAAALNESNIEDALGLRDLRQGVMGICGCGIRKDPDPWSMDLHQETTPTAIGETE